ncbi:MAG TPA: glycosyltransferase family 4 protein [Gammaproteobacteria bacterium]|nr:glycosyltransferase family 4 protein [Gammaproteobacteria bacterium]
MAEVRLSSPAVRFLFVTQVFWPENFRVNDLAAELVARGHEVTVLTGVPNYPEGAVFPAFRNSPETFSRYGGAEIVRIPIIVRGTSRVQLMLNYLSYAVSAFVVGAWKLKGRSFDIIFIYEPSPVTVGLPAVLLRKAKRAAVILWVLDLWPDTLRAIGVVRSPWLLAAVGKLVSFIYDRCDLILGQSPGFISKIRAYCSGPKRIEYFPSWAEALFAEAAASALPIDIPEAPDKLSLMFAGNIGEAQDFPTILDAAEILRAEGKVRWLIVGDGRMSRWVATEVARRRLEDSVLLLGRHPVEAMPAFFRRADAMLVSLKDEPIFAMTIPGKLQSYLAAGMPIIAMLNGEGADVVERARAGLTCRAGDAQGLAAAALRMASMSRDERRAFGQNALAANAAEFDRGRLITQFEQWCSELHARNGAVPARGRP